jgi:hypothetical protein
MECFWHSTEWLKLKFWEENCCQPTWRELGSVLFSDIPAPNRYGTVTVTWGGGLNLMLCGSAGIGTEMEKKKQYSLYLGSRTFRK